jgi:hypothetical protein
LPPLWKDGMPTLKWYIRWKIDVATGRHEQVASPVLDGMSAAGGRGVTSRWPTEGPPKE